MNRPIEKKAPTRADDEFVNLASRARGTLSTVDKWIKYDFQGLCVVLCVCVCVNDVGRCPALDRIS